MMDLFPLLSSCQKCLITWGGAGCRFDIYPFKVVNIIIIQSGHGWHQESSLRSPSKGRKRQLTNVEDSPSVLTSRYFENNSFFKRTYSLVIYY